MVVLLYVKAWALILWDLRPCLHPLYCKLLGSERRYVRWLISQKP